MDNKGYRRKTVRSFLTKTGEVQILLVCHRGEEILHLKNSPNKNFDFVSV